MEFDYSKLVNWVKKSIGYIIIIAIILVRILMSVIDVQPSGADILKIVADCIINGGLALIIAFLLQKQGELDGLASDVVKNTIDEHKRVSEETIPISKGLANWCNDKNQRDLEDLRKQILGHANIKWEEFIAMRYEVSRVVKEKSTVNGRNQLKTRIVTEMVDESELRGKKRRAVKKARNVKITPLSETMLTTTVKVKATDPHKMGRDIGTYDVQKGSSTIIMKIFVGVMLGAFVPTLVEGVTPAQIIWSVASVVLYVAMGLLSYFDAKNYIKTEYKSNFDMKIRFLKEYIVVSKDYMPKTVEQEQKQEQEIKLLQPIQGNNLPVVFRREEYGN